ncbi:hypothetical protein NTG1052_590004 [Candidatus Nitrotoga sp. 1052]|nr:hypothetical protein NTG1052_590004 [Candidatus Nitrotoga sp. 1052]
MSNKNRKLVEIFCQNEMNLQRALPIQVISDVMAESTALK